MAAAQTPDPDAIDIPLGPGGEEYRNTVGRSRIKTDLIYLRPEADETLPRDAAKTAPVNPERSNELARYVMIAILAAILIGLVLFALQFAPATTISMSSPEDRSREGSRKRGKTGPANDGQTGIGPGLDFLNELRNMSDREAALILLLKRALERALEINGMALGRSQTAREILRKLPKTWDHYSALSRLVVFEERVQFGGHDLPEPVFQESLVLAEPIFEPGPQK